MKIQSKGKNMTPSQFCLNNLRNQNAGSCFSTEDAAIEVSSEKEYGRTCGTRYLLDWQIQLGIDSFIDIQVQSHIIF